MTDKKNPAKQSPDNYSKYTRIPSPDPLSLECKKFQV